MKNQFVDMVYSKLKMSLLIVAGAVLCASQVCLTMVLTDHSRLPLLICILLSGIPFGIYMIWVARRSPVFGKVPVQREYPASVPLGSKRTGSRVSIKQNALSMAVLAVVLCILFHKSLFLGKGLVPADGIFTTPPWNEQAGKPISNYLLMDQYQNFIPQHHLLHIEMLKGKLPLWNPYLACGMPTIASMQTTMLFPINMAFSYLEPFSAAGFKAFLKLLLAGFFMVLYMRRLGLGQSAALLSGLVFSLCSFMIVWLGHPHVNCAMWLPLLLYFIEGAFYQAADGFPGTGPRQHLRQWLGFSVAYGLMLLGGHLPTIIHISIIISAYFFFKLVTCRRQGGVWLQAAFFFCGIVAGSLLAAPQLLPFFEYYRESSLALSSTILSRSSNHLHIGTLTYYLLPYIAGSPIHVDFEWLQTFLSGTYNFNERTGFVGLIPLYLSLIAIVYKRNRFVGFYSVLILFCLCVIYGLPPLPLVIRYIPVLSSINHMRLILFICFSLAVLAGFGLEELSRIKAGARWKVMVAVWCLTACFLFWVIVVFRTVLTGNDPASKWFVQEQLLVFCAGIVVATIITVPWWGYKVQFAKVTAVVWVCFELLWFAMDYNPSISRSDYYPKTKAIEFLQRDDSLFRVATMDTVLPPNTAMMYGLYDIRGQDFVTVRRYEELITGRANDFFFYSSEALLPRFFSLLNVKYFLTDKDRTLPLQLVYRDEISIYRVTPCDRAFILFEYKVFPDREFVLNKVRSRTVDMRKYLLLEQQPQLPSWHDIAADVPEPNVHIVKYETDEVTIEASSPRPAFLLLLDTYFPGWKAFINGRETRIYRADYNFRAVALPAGRSTVRFVYQPASFRIGCSLSLACVILLVSVFFNRDRAVGTSMPQSDG